MKTIKMLVISLMALLGFVVLATPAKAAQLKAVSLNLGDTRPSANTTHTFLFTHTSSSSLKKVTFTYCKSPSGTCVPTSVITTGATKVGISGTGITNANFVITNTVGVIELFNGVANSGDVIGSDTAITVNLSGVVNGIMADACDATVGSDTCYVRIQTYTGATGATPVDDGVASYTLVDSVVVTAKVDPTFTFVVSPVAANVVNNGITTSVLSTANTLPFGSLQAGTPKYAAHDLKVTTNTQGGYTVTTQMSNQMTGVYTVNNIDPFVAPWSAATTWTEPTGGTPNDNTGWIGANTTDTDVTNWTAGMTEKFGAVDTANIVSRKSSSDNGLVGVVVTYAIEANVFQPSDAYSGQITYNALPTY